MKFPPDPKTPYLLPTPQDKLLFDKLAKFEGKNLSKEDKKLIEFLYSQLEQDWRTPLEKFNDELAQKYGYKNHLRR